MNQNLIMTVMVTTGRLTRRLTNGLATLTKKTLENNIKREFGRQIYLI